MQLFASSEAVNEKINTEQDIVATGLIPHYPERCTCSQLTSLYASIIDVDGLKRDHKHSGVDGGKLGDLIFSPAAGIVEASWIANWGWGTEGALLIRHSRKDLNFTSGTPYYYSAFYHLHTDVVQHFRKGDKVMRGQILGKVFRPGGNPAYLPEVHWETWAVKDYTAIEWGVNKLNRRFWKNSSAYLLDPLYLLSFNDMSTHPIVKIVHHDSRNNHIKYHGFTYILPCSCRASH